MREERSGIDPRPRIDISVAHPARRYDYWLGGKDNFAADRESGDRIIAAFPTARVAALENRRFMRRAVAHLAGQAGIRQFLDVGTGIPTSPNTHEIAQGTAPEARVVYVDNDPIVLAHARALLTSSREGATTYIDADLRQPDGILAHPQLLRTLDLSQPVALMLVAVLHFIRDAENPRGLVARLVDALAPGSYVVVSHSTQDFFSAKTVAQINAVVSTEALYPRSKKQLAALLDGLELVDPGIVPVSEWRAEDETRPQPPAVDVSCYGTVAVKR